MIRSESRWFPGATEASDADALFVGRLRALAPGWGEYGITVSRSVAIPLAIPFLGVELAHLTSRHRWLWIKFVNQGNECALDGDWGDDKYLDDVGPIDGDHATMVPGSPTAPEELASVAFAWVASQASRAVRCEEWGGPHHPRRWSFVDTGAVLDDTRLWRGRPRRTPRRITIERASI